MSKIIELIHSVDVACPHCGEYNEILYISIAVTVEGVDVGSCPGETRFAYSCASCGESFTIEAVGEIMVRKV